MKKFLLLAAMGLLVTSSAFAVEYPIMTENNCANCGDESETSTDITVCAGVRVPLCVGVEDATITFPCLRRPYNSYATHNTQGWADHWSIDPCNPSEQTNGNTAKIRVQGDADDEIWIDIVQGTGVYGGQLNLQHVNTATSFSTGPHQVAPNLSPYGTGTNPDYLTVTLRACVSQYNNGTTTSNSDVVDANTLDAGPAMTTPYVEPAIDLGGRLKGPNGAKLDSYTLNHFDNTFAGTGGLYIWFGGNVATLPGQQRGQYSGKFKVQFTYAN